MKRAEILAGLWLLLFLTYSKECMSQIPNKVCDTIPYELVHDKIIIPVTVNGVKTKYIVDTGGRTGTTYDIALEMQATAAGYMRVSDVNGQRQNYQEAYVPNVSIGNSYHIKQLKTMVLPKDPFFTDLGVAGILGGDAFAQSVITFDSRNSIIVINYPYRPERLKITDGIPLLDETEYHSFITVNQGEQTLKVLFDTGAEGFLLYSMKDYNSITGIKEINHAHGIVSAGLTGLGSPVEIIKLNIPSIRIMDKEFTNVGCATSVMNETILGIDLLKYGKVIIDYMRKRFFFLPFDKEKTDMDGGPVLWNVSILPRNERFEITTIWDSMKNQVSFGDQIVNINGTSLKNCPMSQIAVEEIMNAIPGNTGYIIVKKDNQEKKIEIKKER